MGQVGAIAAKRPRIDRLVEEMLAGAVVDLDRLVLDLLGLDGGWIGQTLGKIGIDGSDRGHRAERQGEDGDHIRRQHCNGEDHQPSADARPAFRPTIAAPTLNLLYASHGYGTVLRALRIDQSAR